MFRRFSRIEALSSSRKSASLRRSGKAAPASTLAILSARRSRSHLASDARSQSGTGLVKIVSATLPYLLRRAYGLSRKPHYRTGGDGVAAQGVLDQFNRAGFSLQASVWNAASAPSRVRGTDCWRPA